MYVENPRDWIKKPRFEQEQNILARLSLYYVWGKRPVYNEIAFFSYQLSTFISKYLVGILGSCPRSSATCSFYTLRNTIGYKDRCQVIIFSLLRSFYSRNAIC